MLDGNVEGHPLRTELKDVLDSWEGRAEVSSASYRMVRAWRLFVSEIVFDPLTVPAREAEPDFTYSRLAHTEAPLWRLVNERPAHLLSSKFASWDELLLAWNSPWWIDEQDKFYVYQCGRSWSKEQHVTNMAHTPYA